MQHIEEIEAVMRHAFPEGEVDAMGGRAVAIRYAIGHTCMLLSAKIEDEGRTLVVEASPLAAFGFSSAGSGCQVTVPLDGDYEFNNTMSWRLRGARLTDAPRLVGALAEIASEYFTLEAFGSRIAERMGRAFPEAEVTREPHMVCLAFQDPHTGGKVAINVVLGDFDEHRGPIGVYFAPERVFEPFVDSSYAYYEMLLGHPCHQSSEMPFDFERRCSRWPCYTAVFFGAEPHCWEEVLTFVDGLAAIAFDHFFELIPAPRGRGRRASLIHAR